jgi:hypothetical protein
LNQLDTVEDSMKSPMPVEVIVLNYEATIQFNAAELIRK